MKAVIVWWDLGRSAQTIESLRGFLREEAVATWAAADGLLLKVWLADPERNWWGAVQLWRDGDALARPVSTRAAELIGYPPTSRAVFDVDALTCGPSGVEQLAAMLATNVARS
jgi:hypothetical protein